MRSPAQGYGVVLSTHDPDHALLVASRVAIIADGGLRAVGPPGEVVTAETLSAIYRTDVRIEDDAVGPARVRAGMGRRVGGFAVARMSPRVRANARPEDRLRDIRESTAPPARMSLRSCGLRLS